MQIESIYFKIFRKYRIFAGSDDSPNFLGQISASNLWNTYLQTGKASRRLVQAGLATGAYYLVGFLLFLTFGFPSAPVRGKVAEAAAAGFFLGPVEIHPFVVLSIFLSFLTIGAAFRMRNLITSISSAPTQYPETTRTHFRHLRGDISNPEYLDEWIDTHLIADLTEQIGHLFWLPGITFLLMLSTLNNWTDNWPESNALIALLVINFLLSISSIVILQLSARSAKRKSIESLSAKVKKLRSVTVSKEENDAQQAEKLLQEIQAMRRGAFSSFWESSVVGALLLAPGGTAFIQLVLWLVHK